MSQIKKIGQRMEITPKSERLGGVLPAENSDEVITLAQLKGYGVTAPNKKYKALISQVATNAPTLIILENTIGSISWTRSVAGVFIGTLSGAFPLGKTFCLAHASSGSYNINLSRTSLNTIELTTYNGSFSSGDASDDLLNNASIEINVY